MVPRRNYLKLYIIATSEQCPISEVQNFEDLLEKIKATFLLHQKANLESRFQTGEVNFESAANILASAVANSSEAKISARINEVGREDKQGKLRRTRGGDIDVDYSYPAKEYKRLKTEDKNALRLAREKSGKTGGNKKSGKFGGGKKNDSVGISELTQAVKSLKDAMTSQASDDGTAPTADDDSDAPQTGHAGRQFGGRNEKQR